METGTQRQTATIMGDDPHIEFIVGTTNGLQGAEVLAPVTETGFQRIASFGFSLTEAN